MDNKVEFKPLGEIANVVRGASPRPIHKFITSEPDGVNWIKIGDVETGAKYVTHAAQKITKDGALKSRFIKPGDFILSNSMSFGHPYISKIEGCIHDGWLAINNISGVLNPDFLYYVLNSTPLQDKMKKRANLGTVQNLNADIVKSLLIPLPPIEVQEKIVRILDNFSAATDELIKNLERELELRKKQYAYYREKLITTVRPASACADRCRQTGVRLETLCKIGDGLHSTPKYDKNGDYYFINGNNLINGSIIFDNKTKKVNEREYEKYKITFNDKTLFMSINGTIGKVAYYDNEKVILGKSVAYFIVNSSELNYKFLYHYLQCDEAKKYYKNSVTKGTIFNLGLKALRNLEIPLPPLDVQEKIVKILDKFEAYCNGLTHSLPAEISVVS